MELPEIMLQHGKKIVSDEEYKEMSKIDERFCTSDDFEKKNKKKERTVDNHEKSNYQAQQHNNWRK